MGMANRSGDQPKVPEGDGGGLFGVHSDDADAAALLRGLTAAPREAVPTAAINTALAEAASGELAGILEASTGPLVSSDVIGNPHSSIADLPLTQVQGAHTLKVLSWNDNEWGFSNRMLDLAHQLARLEA